MRTTLLWILVDISIDFMSSLISAMADFFVNHIVIFKYWKNSPSNFCDIINAIAIDMTHF